MAVLGSAGRLIQCKCDCAAKLARLNLSPQTLKVPFAYSELNAIE